jgi:tetratricopeptide (TPR) repeat protein
MGLDLVQRVLERIRSSQTARTAAAGPESDSTDPAYFTLRGCAGDQPNLIDPSDLTSDAARDAYKLNLDAVAHCRAGRHGDAERLLKIATGTLDEAAAVAPLKCALLLNLGTVYLLRSKQADAREVLEAALSAARMRLPVPDLLAARIDEQLADLDAAQGSPAAALFRYRRVLAIKEQIFRATHWEVAVTLSKLSDLYFRQERYNEAAEQLLRVCAITEALLGNQDVTLARFVLRLAQVYVRQRKFESAEQILRWALRLFAEALPNDHPDVIACLRLLSGVYRGMSRYSAAEAVAALAQALLNGDADRERIRPYESQKPPRFGQTPVFEGGAA